MEAPNLGPDGCWKAGFVLAIIGLIGVVCAIGYGVYWLITHLKFD